MVLKAGSAAEPWRIRFRKQRVTGNLGAQAGVSPSPLPHPLFVPSPSLPSKILLDIFASLLQSFYLFIFSPVSSMNGAKTQIQFWLIDFTTGENLKLTSTYMVPISNP